MALKISWFSHACFLIETDQIRLLTDPFLTDNPLAAGKADEIQTDYILVSHGHGDHLGDTISIADRTGATVISNYEIQSWLVGQGVENTHPQHIGGGFDYPWGRVKLTIAQHGSALPDGSYGGNPCGFLFYIEGKKIYHACDTGLFYDMKLIGEEGVDLAIRIGALEDSSLVANRIGTMQMWVCAAPNYLDARGNPDSIEDLSITAAKQDTPYGQGDVCVGTDKGNVFVIGYSGEGLFKTERSGQCVVLAVPAG